MRCGSSVVRVCVQDVSQTRATVVFCHGVLQVESQMWLWLQRCAQSAKYEHGVRASAHIRNSACPDHICYLQKRSSWRCPFERPWRSGVTFLHVSAPAAIWAYVYACLSAVDDMALRFCMPQRRRSYGLTFMYMRASQEAVPEPMLLWLEFRAH